jgi:hypothetical protein
MATRNFTLDEITLLDAATIALAPGPAPLSSGPLDLYVSDVNGNDLNNGLSPATALKTITAAEALIPYILQVSSHRVIVHVGLHAGVGYAPPTFRARVLNANVYVYGDGAGQAGETGFVTLVATVASAAGTSQTAVVSAAALGVDAFRGRTIEIMSGPAAGDRRTIRNNSATTFFPTWPFSAVVAPGNTYRVVTPAVVIAPASTLGQSHVLVDGTGGQDLAFPPPRASIFFVNIAFDVSGAAPFVTLQCRNARMCLLGVEVRETASPLVIITPGCVVFSGLERVNVATQAPEVISPVAELGAPSITAWVGWCYAYPAGLFLHFVDNTKWTGFYVGPRVISGDAQLILFGGNLYDGIAVDRSDTAVSLQGEGSFPHKVLLSSGTTTVFAELGAVVTLDFCSVTSTGGNCLNAQTGALIDVVTDVTGSTTIGPATQATNNGKIRFLELPALTGFPALGDLTVEPGGPGYPNATLALPGYSIKNEADGSIIWRTVV